ncbi:hypothetical protein JQN72_03780 [Phycicoccus sp. CSK15P-2]|uniref:hypothetical protein n=1 Tax=Phycicoccus sp. CSK15P-2 TaxID=2807627 RepID=UPI00194EE793|nr:hypothetical protein [Phycicoccus sp. CSK15P-2]MBM6403361.1 hypothetical protein [Phycicoccus sp. CSK15P-2]
MTTRSAPRALLAPTTAALLAAAMLVACSDGGSSAPSTSSSAPPTADAGTTPSPSDKAGRGRPTTLGAEVTRVADDCVYVEMEGRPGWIALRGEVPDVATGDRVEILGAFDDTEWPDCPDGAPFLVTELTSAG